MENVTVKLSKKGAQHSARPGNQRNDLSWQGVHKALEGNGKATAMEIVAAIKEANPENQGNAIGYTKYAIRNGWLEATK